MKLNGRDAVRFIKAPDLALAGVLIYGEDTVEVSNRKSVLVKTLLGSGDDAEMRLTRIQPSDIRSDPAVLIDSMKAQGFFGGQQVVVVDGAGDGTVPALSAALNDAVRGDGYLVVTAGILPARSKLRKLFESMGNAAAAPCYADVPDRMAIRELLTEAGIGEVTDDALVDLEALARGIDKGALRDLIERLFLYSCDDSAPLSADDVIACAPGSGDVDLDETIAVVADGKAEQIGPLLSRLQAQGQSPTGLVIAAQRYFRSLHSVLSAAAAGTSIDSAIGGLRPPVFGPRRDALSRRCRTWKLAQVEGAMSVLLETDNDLRGGTGAPGWPLLERAFLKLALTIRRRG